MRPSDVRAGQWVRRKRDQRICVVLERSIMADLNDPGNQREGVVAHVVSDETGEVLEEIVGAIEDFDTIPDPRPWRVR